MVSLSQLWLPILLAAVAVFVVSAILHMVLKYHNSDYGKLPNEEEIRSALRKGSPGPGQYMMPYAMDPGAHKSPEMVAKFAEGPVGLVLLRQPGPITMGPYLAQWFVYTLLVSLFVGYLASRTLPSGAASMAVCRVAGTAAFLAYAGGALPAAIWRGVPWSVAIKEVFDGLVYGLVTGGVIGWFWPA